MQVHWATNSYRKDRHGELPPTIGATAVQPAPAVAVDPPAHLLAGLGPAGVEFLTTIYRVYEVNAAEGVLARLAGQALDDAAGARAAGDVKAAHRAVRLTMQIMLRLGLPREAV